MRPVERQASMQLWLHMAGVQAVKSNLCRAVGLGSVLCFEICSETLSIADKLAYFLGVVLQGLGRMPAKLFGKTCFGVLSIDELVNCF